LAKAYADGLIDFVNRTRNVERTWFLTPKGCEAVEGVNPNPIKMTPAKASGPTTAHLGLVNAIGIAAVQELGADAEVTWTHEEPLPLGSGRYLRPDAVLSVLVQHRNQLIGGQWFIEADRGTESVSILVDKLANYLAYHQYRPSVPGDRSRADQHWRKRFRSWPKILFVFDCKNPQARIERFAAWAAGDPRLEKHWGTLDIAGLAASDLEHMTSPKALLRIPTLERHDWISLDRS